jgi:hypothetical protein
MYVLAGAVVISKGVGDAYGTVMAYQVLKVEYLRYEDHPYFKIASAILGISTLIDLVFSILGSVGFLFALSANESKGSFIKDVLIHHHGYRLVLISVIHILICSFMMYSINNEHTYITKLGLYLPSWVVALELYTFLELSYVSAKEIILNQGTSSGGDTRSKSRGDVSYQSRSNNYL